MVIMFGYMNIKDQKQGGKNMKTFTIIVLSAILVVRIIISLI